VEAYAGLLWYAQSKGYKRGWAGNKFRDLFGKWPDGLWPQPKEPEMGLVKWIRSQQIRWANSMRNSANTISSRSPVDEISPTAPAPSADLQLGLPTIESGKS